MPGLTPFSKPLEFLQKVKYGGAVRKKTVIICVALIVLGVCALTLWHQTYAILAIAGIVLLIVFFGLRSIDGTLEKHPQLALMDGTEIIRYREIELASKDQKIIAPTGTLVPGSRSISLPETSESNEA